MKIKATGIPSPNFTTSPYDLENNEAYERWRDNKLKAYPRYISDLVVEINDPRDLKKNEYQKIIDVCRKTNMVIYASKTGDDPDPEIPLTIGRIFVGQKPDYNWLANDNGLTSLKVAKRGIRQQFIPYTNREIQWHTDGYYNSLQHQVQALLLHVVQRAARGGENALVDHEIVYIMLREKNPDYIRALMAPDVLTIPARITGGKVARAEESGPVFSINANGKLHMRYTIRVNNVMWSEIRLTQEALRYLEYILASHSSYIFSGLLEPGMGLICNNVLHNRSAFIDSGTQVRHFYRARYFNRITDLSSQ